MFEFKVYEKVNPIWGEPWIEYVGCVVARNEKSALNKATKQFKYDNGGVPIRKRNADNFIIKVFCKVYDN